MPLQPEHGAPSPCLSPPRLSSVWLQECLLASQGSQTWPSAAILAPLVLFSVLVTQDHDTLPQTPLKMQLFQPQEPAFQPQVLVQLLLSYSDCRSTSRPWGTLLSLARGPLWLQTFP